MLGERGPGTSGTPALTPSSASADGPPSSGGSRARHFARPALTPPSASADGPPSSGGSRAQHFARLPSPHPRHPPMVLPSAGGRGARHLARLPSPHHRHPPMVLPLPEGEGPGTSRGLPSPHHRRPPMVLPSPGGRGARHLARLALTPPSASADGPPLSRRERGQGVSAIGGDAYLSNLVDRMIDEVVRSTPSIQPMRSVSSSMSATVGTTPSAIRS